MGVGLGGKTSFFWNPQSTAPDGVDYGNTDWGKSILEQSPQTAFYRQGQKLGIPDDQSGFGRWFRSMFPQFQTGYNAYTVTDPLNANITDYANSLGGFDKWFSQYKDLNPELRGEDAGSRGGGPVRWIRG